MTATKPYQAPRSLDELARIVAQNGVTVLAGGTDLHPRWSRRTTPRPIAVVDIKRVEGLRGVKQADGEVIVGACTLMSELESDPLIRSVAPVLARAAGRIACPQIRNRATIGGNLCNASPAADTAVPLLLLDAVLELASAGNGTEGVVFRYIPITDFFRGPGTTVMAPEEILSSVRFRPLHEGMYWGWDKFGTRSAMEIAVASVGVAAKCEGGVVTEARIAYGSVAPVPMRGRAAEAELVGQPLTDQAIDRCVSAARQEIAPITDVRASAAYRREVLGVMLERMLIDARAD